MDSVHVKLNLLDSQFKSVDTKQDQMKETILKMFDMITSLNDKIDNIGSHPNDDFSDTFMARRLNSVQNEQPLTLPVQEQDLQIVYDTDDQVVQIQDNSNMSSSILKGSVNRNEPLVNDNNISEQEPNITECDNLIISDSMLRRILPKTNHHKEIC